MCTGNSNCGCGCSITLPTGQPGINGQDGEPGENGNYGGYSGQWVFNTSNSSGGLIGNELRMNSSNSTAVTEIYIYNTGYSGINYANFLASFDNGGGFGNIRIFQNYVTNTFVLYQITAVDTTLNGSTGVKLTVTYVNGGLGAAVWANGDLVVVSFNGNGPIGPTTPQIIVADGLDVITSAVLIDNSVMTQMADSEINAAGLGDYLVTADFTILSGSADTAILTYQFYSGATPVGNPRNVDFLAVDDSTNKSISLTDKLTLNSAFDTISIYMQSTGPGQLYLNTVSVNYIKIS